MKVKFGEEIPKIWAAVLKVLFWKVLGTTPSGVLTDITHTIYRICYLKNKLLLIMWSIAFFIP
jgi:hypothetical protein